MADSAPLAHAEDPWDTAALAIKDGARPRLLRLLVADDGMRGRIKLDAAHYGDTLLGLAVSRGNLALAQTLVDAGADPLASIDGGQGATLLATAAAGGTEGHARVLAWLLTLAASPSGGLDLDARDRSAGKTALMVAAAEGNTNAVRSLLCAGADPRLTSKHGSTAAAFAEREDNLAALALLEAALGGDQVDPPPDVGLAPASQPEEDAWEVAAAAVKYLLPPDVLASALEAVGDSVADARRFEGLSCTLAVLAADRGNEVALETLSRLNAGLLDAEAGGFTPLLRAIHAGRGSAAAWLAARPEVDVNCINAAGHYALLAAAGRDDAATLVVLLEAGADDRLRPEGGFTVREWCERCRSKACVEALRQWETGSGG